VRRGPDRDAFIFLWFLVCVVALAIVALISGGASQ
jgi:hypothetical protein